MRHKFLCGCLGSWWAVGLAAQPVPARDLWEFPLGAVLEPAALAREPGGGLWNPASTHLSADQRWRVGVASLATAAQQSVEGQLVSADVRRASGLTLGVSVARASVADILRTESDPQGLGQVLYSSLLLSVSAARELVPHVTAGISARYREGRADRQVQHAVAADLGVIIHNLPLLDARIALSSFLWRPGRELDDRPAFVAATDIRVMGVRDRETRLGYSYNSVNLGAKERGPFVAWRFDRVDLRGAYLRTSVSGRTVSRVRSGLALHYARYVVGVAREEGASGLGPLSIHPERTVSLTHMSAPNPTPRAHNAAVAVREELLDLAPEAALARLHTWFAERGEPTYRAAQVFARLWLKPVATFEEMTELPARVRTALHEHFSIQSLALSAQQQSKDGTEKFLFRLDDGQLIETVAIPEDDRLTLCVSSQAGCALQCRFCATGAMGFQRNLRPSEIAGQVRALRMLSPARVATNIVFMGMGEPMMNWSAVDVTLSLLNDPRALGIGARHITISTVGVLPGIIALGERPEQFRLAISIHAPTDALRGSLMPVNVKYPLSDVIAAAATFDRRVTFEYVLLGGVNDQTEHASQLAALARECRAFVNLIPLHPGGSMGFHPSSAPTTAAFARLLRARGVETAVRRSRGLDISAACGQLRTERLGRRLPVAPEEHGDIDVA